MPSRVTEMLGGWSEVRLTRVQLAGLLTLIVALGLASDFVVTGVFKLIWVIIYAPTHVAFAATLTSNLVLPKFRYRVYLVPFAYLVGVSVGHLSFYQRHSMTVFSMHLETPADAVPIGLMSPDFSEILYIRDQRLSQALAGKTLGPDIEMVGELVTNYGCLQSLRVKTLAGVDVDATQGSSWNWRFDKIGHLRSEPPDVKGALFSHPSPWCWFHIDQINGR